MNKLVSLTITKLIFILFLFYLEVYSWRILMVLTISHVVLKVCSGLSEVVSIILSLLVWSQFLNAFESTLL